MKNQDYKLKYKDLKIKFMDAVDTSFRLGVEQGRASAKVEQAQQQQAAEQASQMQMGQDPSAQPGQEPNYPESPDGSELDQHIGHLEGMLQGSKEDSPEQEYLQKSLNGIKSFRNSLKQASDLRKAEKSIAAIGKAMKTPFTMSKAATKNMSEPAKKALSMQEQVVSDLMKSFEDEEKKASESILKTLDFEQLIKG